MERIEGMTLTSTIIKTRLWLLGVDLGVQHLDQGGVIYSTTLPKN
ncbi:MAG: hypothetical protein ACI8Q1_001424 [Parvicella sp.]|jgi:hypothetical protein